MRFGRLPPDVNRYLKSAYMEAANVVVLKQERWTARHVAKLYVRLRDRNGHASAVGPVARPLAAHLNAGRSMSGGGSGMARKGMVQAAALQARAGGSKKARRVSALAGPSEGQAASAADWICRRRSAMARSKVSRSACSEAACV